MSSAYNARNIICIHYCTENVDEFQIVTTLPTIVHQFKSYEGVKITCEYKTFTETDAVETGSQIQ